MSEQNIVQTMCPRVVLRFNRWWLCEAEECDGVHHYLVDPQEPAA